MYIQGIVMYITKAQDPNDIIMFIVLSVCGEL
jgi:hypothetical protein